MRVTPTKVIKAFDVAEQPRPLDLRKVGITAAAGLRSAGRPAFLVGCLTPVVAT